MSKIRAHPKQRVGSAVLKTEAKLLAQYLVGTSPDQQIIDRYVEAIGSNSDPVTARDARLLGFMHAHPWTLGCLEAGLALRQPYSEVRRRLYIMLAILESSSNYTAAFLPQERPRSYALFIAYAGVRAVCKAAAGVVMLGVVR